MTDQIEIKPTERGFQRGEFTDANGEPCSIQESSAAEDFYIWLGVNDPNPQQMPGNGTGWHPYPLPENVQCSTRMHLKREHVAALLPLLTRFVETGELASLPSSPAPEGQQGWQPIETVVWDEDSPFILAAWPSGNGYEVGEVVRERGGWMDFTGHQVTPEFWMPLPPAPCPPAGDVSR